MAESIGIEPKAFQLPSISNRGRTQFALLSIGLTWWIRTTVLTHREGVYSPSPSTSSANVRYGHSSRIRTYTVSGLNRLPLPVGLLSEFGGELGSWTQQRHIANVFRRLDCCSPFGTRSRSRTYTLTVSKTASSTIWDIRAWWTHLELN